MKYWVLHSTVCDLGQVFSAVSPEPAAGPTLDYAIPLILIMYFI